LNVPLSWLLNVCYGLVNNYALAIIVFTLLTKIILFPVSMWVQKNSIAMVKMTPALNRLKIKYYGDKDTIAEETLVLYKKEKYHPFASSIPMAMGKSKEGPSFRVSAGARLTVILLGGICRPLLMMAA